MQAIIVKCTRLDKNHVFDLTHDWEIKSAAELYNFRRMRIPREQYTHCYVTIVTGRIEHAFTCNPENIGERVFNWAKDFVFSCFVEKLFE